MGGSVGLGGWVVGSTSTGKRIWVEMGMERDMAARMSPASASGIAVVRVRPGAGLIVVELGEGIRATCVVEAAAVEQSAASSGGVDLSQLTSMLSAQWKGAGVAAKKKPEAVAVGQVRSFQIVTLDAEAQSIGLKLV